jgi:hypothetical protein
MRQKSGTFALAVAFVLLFPVLGAAQVNSVRGPVQAPVRMEIKDTAQTPAKAPDADENTRPSKFPNIDTAKNRQDYEMSTPKAHGIRLGRDEDTGDTVMGSTPPKKRHEADPFAAKPIEVRPIIPVPR